MQDKPTLIINRLIVLTYTSAPAYDEKFHNGVNIIRGENSSGKSTIASFIFYVLGGDFNNWTTEALKCRQVLAEVNINGAVITLKRDISESGMQPLSIYYGTYVDSIKDMLNWKTFPYRQTDNNISFSNVLFGALNLPETKSDDSNITMNQILRLMYVDQDTPAQNLFRIERFDLPLTRQTISEVLLGIYEDDLYSKRLDLKLSNKNIDSKTKQFEHLQKILSFKSSTSSNLTTLLEEIEKTKIEVLVLDAKVVDLKSKINVNITIKSQSELEKVQTELSKEKLALSELTNKVEQYEIEIFDSEQFVSTIDKRLVELSHSLLTRKLLGELPLTHCPECLSKLDPVGVDHICSLCRMPLDESVEKANAKRLKQELEIQVRESEQILALKRKKLAEMRGNLPRHIENARVMQQKLNKLINVNQSTRDERIDSLLVEKGNVQNKLEHLNDQIKTVEYLELLRSELEELAVRTTLLKSQIAKIEDDQKYKLNIAMRKIKDNAVHILKNDLERQQEFKTAHNIEINFLRDTYLLNGSNNFSASSKIYFKNAVLFAIFFASLELAFFRYPRFILCDNMEDKGMEKVRTQNFQEVIANMSKTYEKVPHQIIFTTSMVSDKLNGTQLCVGEEYNKTKKSLKT